MKIQLKKAIVPFALFALMFSGCAVLDSSRAYRHETPSEYYLYHPDNYVPDARLPPAQLMMSLWLSSL